ncbi:putative transposase family protein (plasmid) [Clostridium botulinum]|uniref:Putative transposase family protein n=2 Tax=Clostridium botulinum TaxID=1491 RepID=A0A1L7JN20_CLOBO|nr:putative transposase family protein [Clostridium botulinum]
MAIDLGLNNLATITFLENEDSHIINGKPLKSVNSFVNKK